jgi:cytochrome c oxidase subunit 2
LNLILLSLLLLWLCGCAAESPSTFAPQSPAATRLANLWWLLFGLGSVIYVVVMGIMLYGLFRPRQDQAGYERWRQRGPRLILFGGALIPGMILLIIYALTLSTLSALSASNMDENLTIEMTGHQWWWEVRYPAEQITTANEIHIPVGEPVTIHLKSEDVIHSFWVPELNGKLDLVPGKVNTISLQADEPGEYWGLCAEYCGIQHAKMLFVVVAQPSEAFTEWLEDQRQPAPEPRIELTQEGLEVFMEVECAQCHTISGTNARGDLGPDLTHFASRLTLGAGAAPNNRGYLSGWIVDSHGIKPGNLMPPSELTGLQLQALLAYLESLR